MTRWNPVLLRATALALVVALAVGSVGGAVGLSGPLLLAALIVGVMAAVTVVVARGDRSPPE